MHRFTQQAVLLFTLLTLPPAVLADRTYNFLNYPDLQNGWTISGTITTDGTTGTIQSTNILSWTWTITNGVSTYTFSSTEPGASATTSGSGITATGAGLFVSFPYGQLGLSIPATPTTTPPYTSGPPSGMTWNAYPGILFGLIPPNPTFSLFQLMYGPEAAGSSAWLFASASPVAVPEPSSLYIVGFGAVCVYVMGQKCRARRTATTAA